jgi:diguanylate cyclase (GGDEF)-like protein/PAS domain S-box-containing protein
MEWDRPMMILDTAPAVAADDATSVERILAFVQSLNGELESEQIMRRTVVAIAEAVGATQAGLVYVQSDRLLAKCYWRNGDWQERLAYLPLDSSVSGFVASTGRAYICNDVAHDARITAAAKRDRDVHTLLSLPLAGPAQRTIAVLNLHDKRNGAPFGAADIQLASAYLPYAAAAVERAELFEAVLQHEQELDFLANHDPLTGLANRRRFFQEVEKLLRSAGEAWVCVALIDLDGLKDINETFGLQIGDRAILRAGHSLQEAIPPSALAARIGGDEYAVVASGATEESFDALDEQLRRVAAQLGSVRAADGRSILLTGSIGVARGTQASTSAELIASAERLLYEQKHAALAAQPHTHDSYRPRGRRAIAEELAAILQAAGSLSAATDRQMLLERLTEETARIADAEVASVGLLQEDGTLCFRHIWRQGATEPIWETLPVEGGQTGDVLARLDVFRTERATGHSTRTQRLIERYKLRSLLQAPMADPNGRAVGVVLLANKRGSRPFTEHDANLSRAFASLAGTLAENMRLRAETQERSREVDEARRYYSALMEQAGEAVLVMDGSGMTVIDVNQRAVDLYGYSREEFRAFQSGWDIRSEAERARGEGITHITAREGQVQTALIREHLRKDGTPLTVEVTANRIDTPRGPVVLSFIRERPTA